MSVTAATNAISTESRAKFGKCLNEKNYTDLTQMSTLQEVVSYLKQHTWYESVLANVKESAVHRGNLEKMLYAAIRRQICDLCDFDRSVGSNSFRFVDYVEEIRLILCYTRYVLSDNVKNFIFDFSFDADYKTEALYKKIIGCETLKDVGNVLLLTPFKSVVPMYFSESFDYPIVEAQLYRIAFSYGFKTFQKDFSGDELSQMMELLGFYTEIKDLLMLSRALRFPSDDEFRADRLLIGRRCYLNDRTLKLLYGASSKNEFIEILSNTPYKKYLKRFGTDDLELTLQKALLVRCLKNIHFSPYAGVVLLSFIFILNTEYSDIATVIEGVRYHFSQDEILSHLIYYNIKE